MNVTIRAVETSDYEAMQKIFAGPKVVWGTLQLPHPALDLWRKRLEEPPAGMIGLVAVVSGELVGGLDIFIPTPTSRAAGMRPVSACRCATIFKGRALARR